MKLAATKKKNERRKMYIVIDIICALGNQTKTEHLTSTSSPPTEAVTVTCECI